MLKPNHWTKSTASGDTNCVEVSFNPTSSAVQVRDSKHPSVAVLKFSPSEWLAFVRGVKNGEFDITV
jgi:hypothetical protein